MIGGVAAVLYAAAAAGMLLSPGCRAAPDPDAGSRSDRPDLATPTAYAFTLRLGTRPDPQWVALEGAVYAPCDSSVGLHFAPASGRLHADGQAVPDTSTLHVLTVRQCKGASGRIDVRWEGEAGEGLRAVRRGDVWVWTADHWPDRARTYLPVADHPSRPARWRLRVVAPPGHTVLASGAREAGVWQTERQFPAKAVAFVAAPLVQPLDSGRVQAWAPPDAAEAFGRTVASAPRVVRWMERQFGPLPVDTLRVAQADTRFVGMENAGLIVLSGAPQGASAERLIAHEVAHQWFGTAVSEARWSDLWIAEGAATWLAAAYGEERWGGAWADSVRSRWTCPRSWRPDAPDPPDRMLRSSYGCGALVLANIGEQRAWHALRQLATPASGEPAALSSGRLRALVGEAAWTRAIARAKTGG
jgi:hypothetical protein